MRTAICVFAFMTMAVGILRGQTRSIIAVDDYIHSDSRTIVRNQDTMVMNALLVRAAGGFIVHHARLQTVTSANLPFTRLTGGFYFGRFQTSAQVTYFRVSNSMQNTLPAVVGTVRGAIYLQADTPLDVGSRLVVDVGIDSFESSSPAIHGALQYEFQWLDDAEMPVIGSFRVASGDKRPTAWSMDAFGVFSYGAVFETDMIRMGYSLTFAANRLSVSLPQFTYEIPFAKSDTWLRVAFAPYFKVGPGKNRHWYEVALSLDSGVFGSVTN